MDKLKKIFRIHFEWVALTLGLLAMAFMNPYMDNGASWCLFEMAGIPVCPGEGLGHSIAYTFRGDFNNALHSNMIGPVAIFILASRIIYLIKKAFTKKNY